MVNASESQLQKLKLQGVERSWMNRAGFFLHGPLSPTRLPSPFSEQAIQPCRAHAVSSAVLLHPFQASWPESHSQSHTESSEAEVALIKG